MSMIRISPKAQNEEKQMNLTTEQLELIILEELDAVLGEKVEKRGDEYVYVDKKGKVRGRHKTKKAAEKQEKAIYISRNVGEGVEQELDEKASKRARRKKRRKFKKKKGKKDACYHKVRARYDVWPSAYASGALVKCRKVGAKNWGNKSKKNEALDEAEITDQEKEELEDVSKQLKGAVKAHGKQAKTIDKALKKEGKKNCGCGQDPCKTYGIQEQVVKETKKKSDKDRMKCNSPRRIRRDEVGYGKKKFVVKACQDGTEKIIRYGDANMEIKKDSPARRKSFRARHNCDNPGSKLKARYWSCKKW